MFYPADVFHYTILYYIGVLAVAVIHEIKQNILQSKYALRLLLPNYEVIGCNVLVFTF